MRRALRRSLLPRTAAEVAARLVRRFVVAGLSGVGDDAKAQDAGRAKTALKSARSFKGANTGSLATCAGR